MRILIQITILKFSKPKIQFKKRLWKFQNNKKVYKEALN